MTNHPLVFSVSDLTRRIKAHLEGEFKQISVQGELSNCKLHTSGHFYFTLKDEHSQIQGVMWRSRVSNLFFTPEDGMKVIATGNLSVYEVRGVYQIDALQLKPMGVGELQLAFERLKQKLAAEGMFEASHKKPLPGYPRRIALVTSPTGAAIRDMVNILGRRYPIAELVLVPVKVQGAGAAPEIAAAIRDCNSFGAIDLMIVGRGGGSMEDLWAFNEESVARAIYESAIPVISAVGHEIDYTIADFVADLRAPTPSAAAELAVPDSAELVEIVRNFHYTCRQLIRDQIAAQRSNIMSLLQSYSFNRPVDLLRQYGQRLDELQRMLGRGASQTVSSSRDALQSFRQRLMSLNPASVLERGYAIVYRGDAVMTEGSRLKSRDRVELKFHDATRPAVIE
jgi:exodeoxyribonuclease VII large subunit